MSVPADAIPYVKYVKYVIYIFLFIFYLYFIYIFLSIREYLVYCAAGYITY